MSHCVILEYVQDIATITINRPLQLNALSEETFLGLRRFVSYVTIKTYELIFPLRIGQECLAGRVSPLSSQKSLQ